MKYEPFINENLLNNFIDRRAMVQIMLQELDSKERDLVCKKLKMAQFGETLPLDNLSERDFFSTVSYYYLAKEQDVQSEGMFFLYAHDYLSTYKTFDDVLAYLKMKKE